MRRRRRRSAPKGLFLIRDAAKYSDLSVPMVDYLARSGVLTPSGRDHPGRGRTRLYTFGDIVVLRALRHLLAAGIEVRKLKSALETLRARQSEITPRSMPCKYLVTDGSEVFLRSNRKEVTEDLNSGQFVFAFVVELRRVRNDVRERAGLSAAREERAHHGEAR